MSDNIALIRFVPGFVEDGLGDDGLPRYRDIVKIIKSVPPATTVYGYATQADFEEFREPYELFMRQQGAKKLMPAEGGFPLALWPVCSPAELEMLSARGVVTIEQLAKLNRPEMPGELLELVDRARLMIELSDQLGKFEQMVRLKDGQIEVLTGQVKELQATVRAQDGMITALQQQRAA